jgi:iron complex outermembrane receptor protein
VTSTPKPDPANDLAYDPQSATNYEAGLKSELLGRQLRLNAALYLMKSDDYQVFQFLPQPTSPATTDVRITNAGKVTSQASSSKRMPP